ncbi:MAG: Hg(II)-responsive transcriptional regulator [Rhodanobacteraceae bacterium]
MHEGERSLTIGGLTKATGVGVETIRFYQRKGLLPTPHRRYGGIRHYGDADVERLRFVKRAQRIGFSLDEVGGLLKLDDGMHCDEAAVIAAARLADVRAKLADLRRMECALSKLVSECRTRRGEVSCPLITALHTESGR